MTGMSPDIVNQYAYQDLKSLQVKTLSFIAYISKNYPEVVNQYQDVVTSSLIQIMKDCPVNAYTTRKELLVASRHVWYTDLRSAFVVHLDTLLNEDIVLGRGITAREYLRFILKLIGFH